MTDVDWNALKAKKLTTAAPPDWPEGVYAVSLEGLSLFGIHHKTGQLYFDGHEVVTRTKIRLGSFELWLAAIATASTVVGAIIEVGRSAGWWL